MIKVVGLTQHYGVRPVLKNIDFHVKPGELVTVMGPNGMGKTTLLAAVAGALWPQKGYVEIDGLKRRSSEEAELEIRQKTVFLPADPWLPELMTGRDFLLAVGRVYAVEDEGLIDHVEGLVRLFNLTDKADSAIGSYSDGQKKKIALCSAMVTDAKVMILDEPFSGGLDPSGILALKKVLQRLAEREDITLLMATPVPELVEELAHRIAVIRNGEIVAYDTPDGLRQFTGVKGDLQEVLEQLLDPHTQENIDHYFNDESA